jgi:hypothetical protein
MGTKIFLIGLILKYIFIRIIYFLKHRKLNSVNFPQNKPQSACVANEVIYYDLEGRTVVFNSTSTPALGYLPC